MHDAMRKHIQFSTMQRRHGRIPAHDVGGSGTKEAPHYRQHHQLQQPPGAPMGPPSGMPAEATVSAGDGSAGSSSSWVKPGCMMELARLAKIPQPESGIMCPRCQSTETKFCYYNNYSLSQPRHFCKTCRRYWTHGGALRDLPFASSVRRRRSKPANNNKHASSKVACCASGTGRAAAPSSSGATTVPSRRVVAASMTMPPLEQLPLSPAPVHQLGVGGGDHRHRTGASRLWFPGRHSSQLDDHPMGYRHHLLGNSIGGGGATTFKLEHQRYLPQRQPFSFLGYYKNAVTATTSAICPFSTEGGAEAASFAGQMQAISISRVPSSAALTMELASEMMMEENQPIPSTEMMGTLMSSPREFMVGLQGQNDLHFLGSGSWACGYGSTAGNGSALANVWADPSGFIPSSSGTIL